MNSNLETRLKALEGQSAIAEYCNCPTTFDYLAAVAPLLPDYRPGPDQSTRCPHCGREVARRIRIEAFEFGGVTGEQ